MAEISKQALKVANNVDFPDNNAGAITPSILRSYNTDVIDSTVNQIGYTADSGSWNISIGALNAFTASQQPSFTALNAFTASQLTINTGYNAATQSLSASISVLNTEVNSLQAWTGSVNEIIEDNTSKGYAIRFNYGGLISASIVQNVGGNIADITVNTDGTKLDTGSFNAYTASTNVWTASVNEKFVAVGAATASLIAKTGSYATTGSNVFKGVQTFESAVTIDDNVTITGTLTAYEIHTIIESSSVIFSSGSNQFGDSLLDEQILSGSVKIVGTLTANGEGIVTGSLNSLNAYTASTDARLDAIDSTTASLDNSVGLINQFTASNGISVLNEYTASNNTKWDTLQIATASFATTGSNVFRGDQTITGSLIISSSAAVDLQITGAIGASGTITSSGSLGQTVIGNVAVTLTSNASTSSAELNRYYVQQRSGSTRIGFSANPVQAGLTNAGTSPAIYVNSGSNTVGNVYSPIKFQNSLEYTDGRVTITTPLIANTSITITGSAYGNVQNLVTASATASLDLSIANYFTIDIPASSSYNIDVINGRAGQTALLKLTTGTSATASFSSNVLQASGSEYVPSSGTDIITLAAWDSSNVYVSAVQNFV